MKKLLLFHKRHTKLDRIAIVFALLATAFAIASYGGATERLVTNILVASTLIYCSWKVIKVDASFLNRAIGWAFAAMAFNILNESLWFYYTANYGWSLWGYPLDGDIYAFGNYVRAIPVVVMSLTLSGFLSWFAQWLQKAVSG